jgi:hypothetical protein
MTTYYYPRVVHGYGHDLTVLWYDGGDTLDGLTLTSDGRIATFANPDQAQQFAKADHLMLGDDEPSVLDLDAVVAWLARPSTAPVDCELLLDAWNFFTDVASSVGVPFPDRGKAKDRVYDKLFHGNNLPVITPPGEHYTPTWSAQERTILGRVLSHGLSIWQRHHQPPVPT